MTGEVRGDDSIADFGAERFGGKAESKKAEQPRLPVEKKTVELADKSIERFVAIKQEAAPERRQAEPKLAERIDALEYSVKVSPERVDASLKKWTKAAHKQQETDKDSEDWKSPTRFDAGKGTVDGGYKLSRYGGATPASTEVDAESAEKLPNCGFANAQGVRSNNEDSHMAETLTFKAGGREYTAQITGVFDGHGDNGVCSKHAADSMSAALQARLEEFNPDELTDVGVFNALKLAMVDVSRQYNGEGGSTANVVLRIGDDLWIANTGDSRAVLVDPDGKAIQLSEDAKPTADTYNKGIRKRGGMVVFGRVQGVLAVARGIGDHDLGGTVSSRPKVTKYTLPDGGKGYTLAQCCDGVFDVASSNQVGKTVADMRGSTDNATIAANLVAAAFQAGSQDNITAIVTSLGELPAAKAAPPERPGAAAAAWERIRQEDSVGDSEMVRDLKMRVIPTAPGQTQMQRIQELYAKQKLNPDNYVIRESSSMPGKFVLHCTGLRSVNPHHLILEPTEHGLVVQNPQESKYDKGTFKSLGDLLLTIAQNEFGGRRVSPYPFQSQEEMKRRLDGQLFSIDKTTGERVTAAKNFIRSQPGTKPAEGSYLIRESESLSGRYVFHGGNGRQFVIQPTARGLEVRYPVSIEGRMPQVPDSPFPSLAAFLDAMAPGDEPVRETSISPVTVPTPIQSSRERLKQELESKLFKAATMSAEAFLIREGTPHGKYLMRKSRSMKDTYVLHSADLKQTRSHIIIIPTDRGLKLQDMYQRPLDPEYVASLDELFKQHMTVRNPTHL